MEQYYLKDIKCNICEGRIGVFDCKVCGKRICNYCCDLIQLGKNTKVLSKYKFNSENIINKCLECNRYIRDENYNIPDNFSNGYSCYSHIYDGHVIFSSDIYDVQKKIINYILLKKDKSFEDKYMISQCYNVLNQSEKAYQYIEFCCKNINMLKNKDDKIEVYKLYSAICNQINKNEEALAKINLAIQIDNSNPELLQSKAHILRALEKYNESYNCYNSSLEKCEEGLGNNIAIQFNYLGLAIVCSKLNWLEESIEWLDYYINYVGGNEFILSINYELNLGNKIEGLPFDITDIIDVYHIYIVLYLDCKKYDKAREYLEYALIISPNNSDNKLLEGRVMQAEIMEKENTELRRKYEEIISIKFLLEHKQNSKVVINMGDVNFNSEVRADILNTGDKCEINYNSNEEGINKVIELINNKLDSLEIDSRTQEELKLKVSELEKVKNNGGNYKEVLKSIRNILEGVTGSMIATGILNYISPILIK